MYRKEDVLEKHLLNKKKDLFQASLRYRKEDVL